MTIENGSAGDFIDIVMPVRWFGKADEGHGSAKLYGCYADARLRVVSEADAQPVMVLSRKEQDVVFRAHDGDLIEPTDITMDRLTPMPGMRWEDAKKRQDASWTERRNFPFPLDAGAHRSYATNFEDDPKRISGLQRAVEKARSQLEGCRLLEGRLWWPSAGPMIKSWSDQDSKYREIAIEAWSGYRLRQAKDTMSLLDGENIVRALRNEFAEVLAFAGNRDDDMIPAEELPGTLKVVDETAWSRERVLALADARSLDMLRKELLEHVDLLDGRAIQPGVVSALIEVRDAGRAETPLEQRDAAEACCRLVDALMEEDAWAPSARFEMKMLRMVGSSIALRQPISAPELQGFSI